MLTFIYLQYCSWLSPHLRRLFKCSQCEVEDDLTDCFLVGSHQRQLAVIHCHTLPYTTPRYLDLYTTLYQYQNLYCSAPHQCLALQFTICTNCALCHALAKWLYQTLALPDDNNDDVKEVEMWLSCHRRCNISVTNHRCSNNIFCSYWCQSSVIPKMQKPKNPIRR